MSAPDTNIDKQEKRHKPALMGIKGALIFGVVMILLMVFFMIGSGRDDDAEAVVDTGTSGATASTAAPVDPIEPGTNVSN